MIHPLLAHLGRFGLTPYETAIRAQLAPVERRIYGNDRKARTYLAMLEHLPHAHPSVIELNRDWVRIGKPGDLDSDQCDTVREALTTMIPWRKGPFEVFGIRVDSEWVSSLKWDRVRPHIAPLEGRRVLDIGSSCGYYMFRMSADDPALIIGIEPYLTFYFQFLLLQRYIQADRVFTLPLRLEAFPEMPGYFDTVFCMGILYHQRHHLESLQRIRALLRPGGQLILETLILEGDDDRVLIPRDRYAKMNNVYAIPSVTRLIAWLRVSGFRQIHCVDITPTTLKEQRSTEWINTPSLDAFLDPVKPDHTVEGHPAPVRAVVVAHA